jgi:hypothetical protein
MNVKHVDIWILDTEGAEESVLRGTDFNEVHINAVAMECDEHVRLTHSLAYSLTHLLTCLLTYSRTYSLTPSPTLLLTY